MDSAHGRLYLTSFPSRCPVPRRFVTSAVAVVVFCFAFASSVVGVIAFCVASALFRRAQISQRPCENDGGGETRENDR